MALCLQALAQQPGVEGVTLGRSVEEKRTVSQVGSFQGVLMDRHGQPCGMFPANRLMVHRIP